jgi:hypothetical protein
MTLAESEVRSVMRTIINSCSGDVGEYELRLLVLEEIAAQMGLPFVDSILDYDDLGVKKLMGEFSAVEHVIKID